MPWICSTHLAASSPDIHHPYGSEPETGGHSTSLPSPRLTDARRSENIRQLRDQVPRSMNGRRKCQECWLLGRFAGLHTARVWWTDCDLFIARNVKCLPAILQSLGLQEIGVNWKLTPRGQCCEERRLENTYSERDPQQTSKSTVRSASVRVVLESE